MNKLTLCLLAIVFMASSLSASPQMIKVYGGWMQLGPGYNDEVVQIRINDFQLAKHEVTVDEFSAFVDATGYLSSAEVKGSGFGLIGTSWTELDELSWRDPGYVQTDEHPVASLSWYDAISYCNWLSLREGLTPVYSIDRENPDPNNLNEYDIHRWTVTWDSKANGYRLPTTAEWEYAASSGGLPQNYVWGQIDFYEEVPEELPANLADESHYGHYVENDDVPWVYLEDYDDGYAFTSPVGSFAPNALGFHDLAGNVSELCWDWHHNDYFPVDGAIDPKGPDQGSVHAQRGSAWCDVMDESLVGYRRDLSEEYMTYSYIGMRLARNVK